MTNRKAVPGFDYSEMPPRASTINLELTRSLAEATEDIVQMDLDTKLADHKEFLAAGGGSGKFERMEVAGMPLNIYLGSADKGTQLAVKRLLPYTNLSEADLSYSDFSGSLCEKVDFSKSKMNRSMFTDAFFKEANFEGASCKATDFTNSDLRYANFRNADLRHADFEIANCEFADYTGAKLEGASFKGANLENIKR